MENRIKECQLDLFADRTSAATLRANQLRLWFASFAYVLLSALRRLALRHTTFQTATCGTIRLKLLKIAARVTVFVRRITVSMATAFPGPKSCGSPAQGFSPPRQPRLDIGSAREDTTDDHAPAPTNSNAISGGRSRARFPPLTLHNHLRSF